MSTQYLSSQGFNGEGTIITWYANYPGNDFQKCNLTGWSPIINAEYHEISTAIYDYYPWFYYYKIIGNANTIICEVDNATGSAADKQFLKAQALTFRAYCYLMLSQLYSHRWQDSNNGASRGLPLRIDESKGDLPASTLAETYARIYKDLDEAIAGYTASGQDRNSKENYAVNIDVAYAIYARAALTREDWENAAKYAALARKKYKLMTNKEYVDGGSTHLTGNGFGAFTAMPKRHCTFISSLLTREATAMQVQAATIRVPSVRNSTTRFLQPTFARRYSSTRATCRSIQQRA